MFYALSSENQAYFTDKVNLFVALAPVTKMDNTDSKLLKFLDRFESEFDWITTTLDIYELFASSFWVYGFKVTCGAFPSLCYWTEGYLITQKPGLDDADRF